MNWKQAIFIMMLDAIFLWIWTGYLVAEVSEWWGSVILILPLAILGVVMAVYAFVNIYKDLD